MGVSLRDSGYTTGLIVEEFSEHLRGEFDPVVLYTSIEA
jgi:hypothetical protein